MSFVVVRDLWELVLSVTRSHGLFESDLGNEMGNRKGLILLVGFEHLPMDSAGGQIG